MAILDQFVIELLFDNQKTKESAGETQKIVSSLVSKAITTLGLIATFDFSKNIVDQFTQTASSVEYFSQSIGESVENVSAWQQAVIRTGGSADGLNQSLSSLYKNINEIALTGQGSLGGVFNYLGVSAVNANGHLKTTTQILLSLSDSFKNLSIGKRNYIGEKLGLDPATIRLLGEGKTKVEDLIKSVKQYGVITEEQAKQAIAYKNVQANLSQSYTNLKYQIAEILLPVFTKFSNALLGISQWFRANQSLVEGAIIGIASVITAFLLPSLLRLGLAIIPLLPMLAILTAIGVAVALVAQDVIVWLHGGNSAFGAYYQKIANIYHAIKDFTVAHKEAIEKFGVFVAGVAGSIYVIEKLISTFAILKTGLTAIKFALIGVEGLNPFGWVVLAVSALTALGYAIYKNWDIIKKFGEGIKSWFSGISTTLSDDFKKIGSYFNTDTSPLLNINQNITPQTLGATQATNKFITQYPQQPNTSHMVNIDSININVANGNAAEIAKGISSAINEQVKRNTTMNAFNSALVK